MIVRTILGLMLLLASLPAFAEGRVALVVGVSQYDSAELQPLPNAVADASRIGAKLRTLGFDTDIVLEPTRDELRQALSRLFLRRQSANAETALFYFAGHGLQAENQGFLLARDSTLAPRAVLAQRREVNTTDLVHRLREAKLAILFLDACRNTPSFVRNLERRAENTLSAGLSSIGDRATVQAVISYATLPSAQAIDALPDHPNSPYAEALLDYMDRPDMELADMLRSVSRFVKALTREEQQPAFEDRRGPGTAFYFSHAGLPLPAPSAAAPPPPGQVSAREAVARLTGTAGPVRSSALAGLLAPPGLRGPIAPETALTLLGDIPDDAGRRRRALSAMLPLMDLPLSPRDARRLLAGLSPTSRLAALSDMLGCLARPLQEDQAQSLIDGIPTADVPRLFRQLTLPTNAAMRCGS